MPDGGDTFFVFPGKKLDHGEISEIIFRMGWVEPDCFSRLV